jgi:signal peptidase I
VAIAIAMPLIGTRLAAFFRRDLVQAYRTPAGSMSPTLMVGDHFFANKLAYLVGEPRRFDVVVFEDPTNAMRTFVKRVVGLPGDTVQIEDGRLQLNGSPIDERYATASGGGPTADASGSWQVPAGEYFVLGDFRNASVDSRRLGGIPRDKIGGRVQRIYWSWDAVRHAVRWDRNRHLREVSRARRLRQRRSPSPRYLAGQDRQHLDLEDAGRRAGPGCNHSISTATGSRICRCTAGRTRRVYGYPSEHYAFWREQLPDAELPWGAFGENLTTKGCRRTAFASAIGCAAGAPSWWSRSHGFPATSSACGSAAPTW